MRVGELGTRRLRKPRDCEAGLERRAKAIPKLPVLRLQRLRRSGRAKIGPIASRQLIDRATLRSALDSTSLAGQNYITL